ncbi:bifunctional oligoribonuclease/PAP phosphatase NrnA [Clostridia bacterium]|nr:bifunctional oligoribonuclease/PAP phosphatase NrnA [Clostridia bacterium]
MSKKSSEILSMLKGKKVLVTSHRDPDGDCIGSTVAMTLALKQLGFEADALNLDEIPYRYTFCDPSKLIYDIDHIPDRKHEVVVVLDSSDLNRLGYDMKKEFPRIHTIINIDHHRSNVGFGDLNIVEDTASANCEILFRILTEWEVQWNSQIANALYTGITTDTGSFKYESTSSETLRIAASLIDYGADINIIRASIWENEPYNRIRALSDVLDDLKITKDGRISWIKISLEEIQRHKLNNGDLESFVDYPRTVTGVEVALFIKEMEMGKLKVSVRTKSCIDATKIASIFGGGGHKRAAGFKVEGKLDEQEQRIIKLVQEEVDKEYQCMDSLT